MLIYFNFIVFSFRIELHPFGFELDRMIRVKVL